MKPIISTDPNGRTERRVIFLHIPKTAGTTLHRVIERHYAPRNTFSMGPLARESVQEFKSLSPARRSEIWMLKGHMGFGLHEYLPGPSTYFTLLREPIDRAISHFYFIRRNPKHYLHNFATADNVSLSAFVASRATIMMDNPQARMLSGVWYAPEFGACGEEVLERAKRNLEQHFSVVGLTERFDETLLLLKKAFGWQKLLYVSHNVTAQRPKQEELPAQTLEALTATHQLDIELYQFAQKRFKEQIRRQGPSFAQEVARFQRLNRLARPLLSAYQQVRKRSLREFIQSRLPGQ